MGIKYLYGWKLTRYTADIKIIIKQVIWAFYGIVRKFKFYSDLSISEPFRKQLDAIRLLSIMYESVENTIFRKLPVTGQIT